MRALNKILIVVVSVLLLNYFVKNVFCETAKRTILTLTLNDKKFIADYVYSVMNFYINEKKVPDVPGRININLNFDYDKVFISLYKNNAVLGCQRGSAKKDSRKRLLTDLRDASIKALEDKRFTDKPNKKLDKDNYIVINFLFNKQKMAQNELAYLKENFELGMHSVSLAKDNKQAYFISSVPITKNYDLEKTLKRLCKKGGFGQDCFLDKDTDIYRYDTIVFKADTQNNITDLYRFNILVDQKDIGQKRILESITLAKDWVLNNINPETGLLEYAYYPSRNLYSKKNQHTRQLAMLWALTVLREFSKTKELDSLIKRTFDYYLAYEHIKDNYAYLAIDKNPSIALNAFMIMALLNSDLPQKEILMGRLAKGILSSQLPDGSYRTNFMSKEIKGIDYYPGEAMLALMKLYAATNNPAYLDSVKRAFHYYSEYWRNHKNTAFIPWHTQAYYLLYKETRDKELVEFIFEMNDWLIDNYQLYDSQYMDKIGGFTKSNPGGGGTAVYLEGINDAYSLAVEIKDGLHKNKYGRSVSLGTRFILQSQFNKANSFYLENPKRAIGGIGKTLTNNKQRVDCIQHLIMALFKTYKNKIFE